MFEITSIYAGLMGLFIVGASFRVSQHRIRLRISRGDGGDKALGRAIRRQGNMIEYVPISLILIAMVEAQSAPSWVVHGAGLILLVSRAAHYFGMGRAGALAIRQFGMLLCYVLIAVLSLGVLGHALF